MLGELENCRPIAVRAPFVGSLRENRETPPAVRRNGSSDVTVAGDLQASLKVTVVTLPFLDAVTPEASRLPQLSSADMTAPIHKTTTKVRSSSMCTSPWSESFARVTEQAALSARLSRLPTPQPGQQPACHTARPEAVRRSLAAFGRVARCPHGLI